MALFFLGEANMSAERQGTPERVGSCAQAHWARAGTSTAEPTAADAMLDDIGGRVGRDVDPAPAAAAEPIEDEAGYGYGV